MVKENDENFRRNAKAADSPKQDLAPLERLSGGENVSLRRNPTIGL
jgi:hypothetical protein